MQASKRREVIFSCIQLLYLKQIIIAKDFEIQYLFFDLVQIKLLFWIYLSTILIVITQHGMKAFLGEFLGGQSVQLAESFYRFSGKRSGRALHEISVCGGYPHGKIGWRSFCVLHQVYLFICLLVVLFIVCAFAFYVI